MQKQEEVLRELLYKVAQQRGITNYELDIKTTSSEGANFTSALFYVTITNDQGIEEKLFAKVSSINEKMREMVPYHIFETESFFYTDLVKTYKNIEETHNVPKEHRLVTPEFYGVSMEYQNEVFVMEDLTSKGYQMFNRFNTVDWKYTQEAMSQLAAFHALSMAYGTRMPEEFRQKTKQLKVHNNVQVMQKHMADLIKHILPHVKEEYRHRLQHLFEVNGTTEKIKSMVEPIKCTILGHGDYRPSNLMHKQNEDGSYSVIIIDYQTLNLCNPIVDILFFVFGATDQKFRSQYYQKTLDHYYAELCVALTRFQLNPDEVYPREHFEFDLKKVLPYGLIMSSLLLLLVTMEVDKVPDLSVDSDFKNNNQPPSELYGIRLNEVIQDYVSMGVL